MYVRTYIRTMDEILRTYLKFFGEPKEKKKKKQDTKKMKEKMKEDGMINIMYRVGILLLPTSLLLYFEFIIDLTTSHVSYNYSL